MARVYTLKANKAYPDQGIAKGDTYYKWQLRYGPVMRSKTPPKASQLTFLSSLYDLQERAEGLDGSSWDAISDLESEVQDIASELESLKDDAEGNLSNMPDALQQGPTGEMLQQRVDRVGEIIDELNGIDFSEPEEIDPQDLANDNPKKDDEDPEAYDDRIREMLEEATASALQERIEEIAQEISGIDWSVE